MDATNAGEAILVGLSYGGLIACLLAAHHPGRVKAAILAGTAALGLGGYWLRRWIVPEFTGALARLADATLAVALLVVCLEILGSLSLLYFGWLVLLCVAVGLGSAWLGRAMAPGTRREVQAPRVETIALLIALGVASFTVAEWTFPSQLSLDQGMFGGDTTWYHMPFAADIAQSHSVTGVHHAETVFANWFYPQNSELLHAVGQRVEVVGAERLIHSPVAAERVNRDRDVGAFDVFEKQRLAPERSGGGSIELRRSVRGRRPAHPVPPVATLRR